MKPYIQTNGEWEQGRSQNLNLGWTREEYLHIFPHSSIIFCLNLVIFVAAQEGPGYATDREAALVELKVFFLKLHRVH